MVGPTVSEEVAGAYWQQCAKIDGCQDRTRLTDPIAPPQISAAVLFRLFML